jgi:hypothetical protein
MKCIKFLKSGKEHRELVWSKKYNYSAKVGDTFILLEDEGYFKKFKIDKKLSDGLGWLRVLSDIEGVYYEIIDADEYIDDLIKKTDL